MKKFLTFCLAGVALSAVAPAFAQNGAVAPQSGADERSGEGNDIIVTARRREETLQNVPVVVTAFGKEQIDRLAIQSIDDIAKFTPSFLAFTDGSGSSQGVIAIRGVSTGFLVTGGNQAVSTNIDGVQISQGIAARPAQIDVAQVEVLKGPQALFFGKNSTAGIVSIRTADPTSEMFMQVRGGYELRADERFGEVIMSGPVSDAVGLRGVFYASDMKGFQRDLLSGGRLPNPRQLFGRVTATYKDGGAFDARLKFSYFDEKSDSRGQINERTNCQLPAAGDDCKLNGTVAVNVVPGHAAFQHVRQALGSAEFNFHLNDQLTLTSLTGYQWSKLSTDGDTTAGPLVIVPSQSFFRSDAVSEELRLASDFEGPLNFMLGGIYERSNFRQFQMNITFGPTTFPQSVSDVRSDTYSAFGQLTYKLAETVELSGGARWSSIRSRFSGQTVTSGLAGGNPLVALGPIGNGFIARNRRTFNDLSPEATLTWRPTSTVTMFVALKEGFKAGGFDLSPTRNPLLRAPLDISYGGERARGGEAGFKTEWFDRSLRINGAVYRYDYSDLQLSAFDPTTVSTRIFNAAKARVQGAELETSWTPPELKTLTLFGAVSYNRGRFRRFIADCNQSQIAGRATGCVERNGTAGLQTSDANNVAGRPLPFAPNWSGSFGFNTDFPISDSIKLRANAIVTTSSSYLANSNGAQDPLDVSKGFTQVGAGIGIHDETRGWALDVITQNLFNKYYVRQSIDLSGSGLERAQLANRPREVMLQLTLKPSMLFR